MVSRRQAKVSRVIKETVSMAIRRELSDPRIEKAMISVTRVEISPDLRTADVYLSIYSKGANGAKNALDALKSASGRLQAAVGKSMTSKFCPSLRFHEDVELKKTLEMLDLIEKANPKEEDFEEEEE